MSRKKHRYKKVEPKLEPVEPEQKRVKVQKADTDEKITRYKAVVRSPLGEWWHDNKKRVRLFSMISGGGLLIGWLIFELLNLIF